jgi:phasin family protein
MQNNFPQLVNEVSNTNRSIFETFEQLAEANSQTWEKLVNAQLDLTGILLEASAKQLKAWSDARNFRDVLAAQAKLTEEYGDKILKNARQQVAIIAGARDAYSAWVEQGVENASEKFRRTADTATRRAA